MHCLCAAIPQGINLVMVPAAPNALNGLAEKAQKLWSRPKRQERVRLTAGKRKSSTDPSQPRQQGNRERIESFRAHREISCSSLLAKFKVAVASNYARGFASFLNSIRPPSVVRLRSSVPIKIKSAERAIAGRRIRARCFRSLAIA